MTSILDPNLLRTLVFLHDEGSFTKAGERLGLTQQAISAHVKRIESAVNRQIVLRRGARLQLTNDGEALLAYARQALTILEQVRQHFSTSNLSGRVRIGILEGFASVGLPIFLASLRVVQPNLEVFVETGFTEKLVLKQENGQLDVILGAQRRGQRRGEKLWDDHLQWFGDLEPYGAGMTPVRLALPPEPSLVRDITIEAMTAAGRPYEIIFESESRSSLRAAALAGMGVTVFCSFDKPVEGDEKAALPRLEPIEYFLRTHGSASEILQDAARLLREAATNVLRDQASTSLWMS